MAVRQAVGPDDQVDERDTSWAYDSRMPRPVYALILAGSLAVAVPASAQDGATLYAQRCQSCHEGGAASRAPGREVIAALTADRIVQSLESGLMRQQGEGLTPAERSAIAAFLSVTRPTASTPTGAATCPDAGSPARAAVPGDWNGWGVSFSNERFQRQPGLTAEQVPNLELKWAVGFEGDSAAATQPTIAGGRVYVSGAGRVHALDLQSGCSYWSFRTDARVRAAVIVGPTRSGLAAFIGDQSATVYSVDTTTGQLRWKRKVEDHRASRITGGPVLYEGRLYVPVSSGEEGTGAGPGYQCCTFRGSVVALDAETGDVLWKTYTISEAPIPTIKNSAGTQLYGPSGAAVWSAPTIDPTTRSIYVTTGDAYTAPAWTSTDAIMALDMNTGAIKWVKQLTGGDAWNMACGTASPANCPGDAGPDHDFGQSAILVSLSNGRRALVAAQKSGQIHAVDPDDRGRLLWSIKPAKGGMLGGFEWGSASDGQYFYAPTSDIAFKNPAVFARGGVEPAIGGGLLAVRVTDGSIAWSTPAPPCTAPCSPAQSAPAAVMPGVVFSGSVDGNLRAYSTRDGKIIWTFDTARPFETVNGVKASGGSIDVGGPAISNGIVLTTSGYAQWGGKPGNVLLAFGVR